MISKGDKEGKVEIEEDLDYIIKRNRTTLTTPIFAFITFTT